MSGEPITKRAAAGWAPSSTHRTISDMTTMKKTANEDCLKTILDANPQIHRDTLERARQVEEQLAAVGIKLGGYRLDHPLGGPMQPSEQPLRRRANR